MESSVTCWRGEREGKRESEREREKTKEIHVELDKSDRLMGGLGGMCKWSRREEREPKKTDDLRKRN